MHSHVHQIHRQPASHTCWSVCGAWVRRVGMYIDIDRRMNETLCTCCWLLLGLRLRAWWPIKKGHQKQSRSLWQDENQPTSQPTIKKKNYCVIFFFFNVNYMTMISVRCWAVFLPVSLEIFFFLFFILLLLHLRVALPSEHVNVICNIFVCRTCHNEYIWYQIIRWIIFQVRTCALQWK